MTSAARIQLETRHPFITLLVPKASSEAAALAGFII